MKLKATFVALVWALTASPSPAVQLQEITTATQPVYVTHAGDGSGRLFIVERAGTVLERAPDGTIRTFLDLTPLVGSWFLEMGLLSIAFHPAFDGDANKQVFVSFTDVAMRNVVARFEVDVNQPNAVNLLTGTILFTQMQPFPNHNGGLIKFGPDGYLYMGIGDGGLADDPFCNAQDRGTLLGAIQRLDVLSGAWSAPPDNPFVNDGDPATRDEIWAFGLRNPWRFSFDRATGDLYIADVGQNEWEEVNFQPASSSGGQNYGWPIYEASSPYNPNGCAESPPAPTFPVTEYSHEEGCSISGGYVYRGSTVELASLTGKYLFGDYCSGTIWTLENGVRSVLLDSGKEISSFGEGEDGEVYVTHLGLTSPPGAVFKIVP